MKFKIRWGSILEELNRMEIQKIAYHGWENCYQLTNPSIELVAVADIGPRILRLAFRGKENQFCEYATDLGKTGGDDWRLYGGHRFWHAPEALPRTYFPDNHPVEVQVEKETLRLIQPVECTTGIQKELEITLDPGEAQVKVVHRLHNANLWAVELAPWALTLMALDGTAVLPLPPRRAHEVDLLPSNTLSMWSYTDLSDDRWHWGKNLILLRQNPQRQAPQKIGLGNPSGWIAYVRKGDMFVKYFDYQPDRLYPDGGCNTEVFTRFDIMELESLGPLVRLEPGGGVEHVERWRLFKNIPEPVDNDQVVARIIPVIEG